jgi:chromosome segregation ATPase
MTSRVITDPKDVKIALMQRYQNELENDLEQFKIRYSKSIGFNEELKKEIKKLKETITGLKNDCEIERKRVFDAIKGQRRLEKDITNIKKNHQNECDRFINRLTKAGDKYDAVIVKHRHEMNDKQRDIDIACQVVKEKSDRLKELHTENGKLKIELRDVNYRLKNTTNQLEESKTDLTEMHVTASSLTSRYEKAIERIRILEAELAPYRETKGLDLFAAAETGEDIFGAFDQIMIDIVSTFPFQRIIEIGKRKTQLESWTPAHARRFGEILRMAPHKDE